MSDAEDAIDALENLGLTEYEARCFVALAQLSHGTAREIGQVADIPRSRVYETMERLQNRGLVELHDAEPRKYQSVSVDTALELLRNEYDAYFESVDRSLRQLEPTYKKAEQGVWALNTHDQISGRVSDLLDGATEEIVYVVLDDDLLDETVLDALAAAADRDVVIHVGTASEPVSDRFEAAEIDAVVFATELIEWFTAMADSPRIGRLLLVDRDAVLVSALHEEELPGVPNETATWSDGIDHGFATFAERVITHELERTAAAAEDPD